MTHRTMKLAPLLRLGCSFREPYSGSPKRTTKSLALLVSGCLVLASVQAGCASQAPRPDTPPAAEVAPQPSAQTAQVAQQSPAELDQLVAPIALYPDALVAQILAAATYPTEVVEAQRWIQQHSDLKGEELAKAVDPQSWDPSIKAVTQFPSVLAMMDKDLSWTSALGEAYADQPQNVLDAVQVMRQRAQQAGSLKSTPQESVTTQGQTIVIQPTNPEVVYVPEYDPWVVYGEPLAYYPGWVGVPGAFVYGPGIEFGLGIGIGFYGGFGWGWNHWGADWHRHDVEFDHHHFISHGRAFGGHGNFDHGHAALGHAGFSHPGGFAGRAPAGGHSSAFSGFNHGGVAGAYSSRGQASFGGGAHGAGGSHGGGFHGGGGHGGGGGGHR
jgi:Protein of unknown function (DUF3300)